MHFSNIRRRIIIHDNIDTGYGENICGIAQPQSNDGKLQPHPGSPKETPSRPGSP